MNGKKRILRSVVLSIISSLLLPSTTYAVTKAELMSTSVKIADSLASKKDVGRNWEDVPFLVGETYLHLAKKNPGEQTSDSDGRFLERVVVSIGDGYAPITHGDYASYAQASLDAYQLTTDAKLREKLLRTTDGPLAFARFALRATPENSPPMEGWWVEGGYGMRLWVDDLSTIPVWLAMLGSTQNGLPGNEEARNLAYEMVTAYVAILWDKDTGLFWHDQSSVGKPMYWGRGNGWAAYGLDRTASYLDTPYTGNVAGVLSRDDIRALLTKMATALILRRTPDGGWPSDLANPLLCGVAETSATGFITFMLKKGMKEGWLDRNTYLPVVRKALDLLLSRVDANGDVSGIQPPGTGADCYTVYSDDSVNVNYGVGAVILAFDGSEDEDSISPEFPRRERPQREIYIP